MAFTLRLLALAAAVVPFLAQAAPVAQAAGGEQERTRWLIQLKPTTSTAAIAEHKNAVREIHARNVARRDLDWTTFGGIEKEYGFGDFHGYSGCFDSLTIDELSNLPEVLSVEADFYMQTFASVTQTGAPWGLASISSRTKGATNYFYDSSAGTGQYNYVVDTGVRITHQEFSGRAQWGFNAIEGSDDTDKNGHGTHVAGTIAGTTYGVAKNSTIVAVKVFDSDGGSAADVIDGLNWAVNDIVSKQRTNSAVINMSLGGRGSATMDAAVTAAWNQGVLLVVAAGNFNADASGYSPARSPEPLTVGNVQSDDNRYQGSTGSNYGPDVDIWAPGTGILSSYIGSDTSSESLTGTSMASPHVAGLVSYLRALEGPLSATDVRARVIELATPDRVQDTKGAANLLAFNGYTPTAGPAYGNTNSTGYGYYSS